MSGPSQKDVLLGDLLVSERHTFTTDPIGECIFVLPGSVETGGVQHLLCAFNKHGAAPSKRACPDLGEKSLEKKRLSI